MNSRVRKSLLPILLVVLVLMTMSIAVFAAGENSEANLIDCPDCGGMKA